MDYLPSPCYYILALSNAISTSKSDNSDVRIYPDPYSAKNAHHCRSDYSAKITLLLLAVDLSEWGPPRFDSPPHIHRNR